MSQKAKFYCAICQAEYNTENEAFSCESKNGPPQKPNFKIREKVYINNSYFPRGQIAIVMNFGYCKPNQLGRKPHQLLYLLILPNYCKTTAIETELSSVQPSRSAK